MPRISKNVIGTLEIEPEHKTIWLNAPHCVLRIQGITFKNIEEKFSSIMIDQNNQATMIVENQEDDVIKLLERVVSFIYSKCADIPKTEKEIENCSRRIIYAISKALENGE